MGDQKGGGGPVVPDISYEDGISTIRISSKDLPQRPQIEHVVKSSTIPRVGGEGPTTDSFPLEGCTQSSTSLTPSEPVIITGPGVGSVRVSTLERPTGVSKPSTFEPLRSQPTHPKSSSTELLVSAESVAPFSSLEVINPTFEEPDRDTSASIVISKEKDKPDDATVHTASNGSIPKGLPTVTEEGGAGQDRNHENHTKLPPPVAVTPAPPALRKSSDEPRASKKNRKVSWNEQVVVTPDNTCEGSIINLQPEDHEFTPVESSSVPQRRTPNGNVLHTGLDGEEFKDYDLLNTEPLFVMAEGNKKQKWMLVILFILFIIVTIIAVAMGVLYGLSKSTDHEGQVSSLREVLGLMEPTNAGPFPSSWSTDADTGAYILVDRGERMTSQKPSVNAVMAWYLGQRLKVTVRNATEDEIETVYLGDPLGSSISRLTLLMDTNHWYEAEPADDQYCLVSVTAFADTPVTWTP